MAVKTVFGVGISYPIQKPPAQFVYIYITPCGYLSAYYYKPHCNIRLAGDPPVFRILSQDFVQDRIRYLIADFIRMPLSHALRSKKILSFLHYFFSSLFLNLGFHKINLAYDYND